MPAEMSVWKKLAIVIMVVTTGYSLSGALWQNYASYRQAPACDPVTVLEEKMTLLKGLLPPSGSVGYVTSIENDRIFAAEKTFTNVEYLGQFVLTQYTLAPLVVRNSPDFPLVVGNFIQTGPPAGLLEKHGLTQVRDLGDGLVLYRGKERP